MTTCILNCLKISKGSPKRHNGGKNSLDNKTFMLQSSHIMILNSTKFGGKRTKVDPDSRQTDRQTDRHTDGRADRQTGKFLYTPQTTFAGV